MVLPTSGLDVTRTTHAADHLIINRSLNELCDIRYYGASTASADNSAAIQAALDAAALLGTRIHIPPGTYSYASTLVTKGNNNGFSGPGKLNYTGNGYALVLGNASYTTEVPTLFRRVGLDGISITGTPDALGGVRVFAGSYCAINRGSITGFTSGPGILFDDQTWINSVRDSVVSTCKMGIQIKPDPMGAVNAITIDGGEIGANCDWGVVIGGLEQTTQPARSRTTGVVIHACTIEGAKVGGIWVVDAVGVDIHGCYFESTTGVDIQLGNDAGVKPRSVSIHNNHSHAHTLMGVLITNVTHADISENWFYLDGQGQDTTAIKYIAGTSVYARRNDVMLATNAYSPTNSSGEWVVEP